MLDRVLEVLTGSQWIQDKLQRNEHVIRLLKQLGLDPDHPPTDFEGVYNYALVEYGVDKPRPCLEIFRAKEIQQAFRTAFDQNNAQLWLESGDQFLASSAIGDAVAAIGLDPQRELALFAAQFVTVAKRTRHAGDVLLSHQVADVQQSVRRMAGQLETLASQGAILPGRGAAIAGSDPALLPPSACRAAALGQQMRGWFKTLGYRFEAYEVWHADYFEWVINIPVRRGRYDRVLVRGVAGEVGIQEVRSLCESVAAQKTDEGWVVTDRRISQAARGELAKLEASEDAGLAAFTWDELLDQDADFSSYVDWLTAEIERRGIEAKYVPLACTKEEVDPSTHQRLGVSRYGAADGWTEGYIDRWLDDPAKEHLSILGEFGTGKTWLTLHYAAQALRAYREAQAKGMNRPRLPIVIPLRDYAKAVSVESLFSEFFFRKHEIPIPGYSAFEQLNRMGKLLLIFDGFDEMAARVDKQQMINNFWELAKVVVPGSKVVLTCRTEHFPEAREGRALLNAELQASTKDLTGETPQFEVLELEKFEDEQIRQVLALQASEGTVAQVLGNPHLLDLARRPVMTELILEALPEIEAGKPVDMSRVYLYAVKRKMERDIKAERTFTSMADKLYFLCELSWEMLSSDRMSINYREFPDRIRKLFGAAVQEEKDLDHWHYDMMGQTMLIRNADGDYSPAHRSLLEFFVAFKFAAELGVLAPDFTALAQMQPELLAGKELIRSSWLGYLGTMRPKEPLRDFSKQDIQILRSSIGANVFSKALLDLLLPMIEKNNAQSKLYSILLLTRDPGNFDKSHVGGNIATLMVKLDRFALENLDLSGVAIGNADLSEASLCKTNFAFCNFQETKFTSSVDQVFSISLSSDGKRFATGGGGADNGQIYIWNLSDSQCALAWKGHARTVRVVAFHADSKILASAGEDNIVKIWNSYTGECLNTFLGHSAPIRSISFHPSGQLMATCSEDCTVRFWNLATGESLEVMPQGVPVRSVSFSPDGETLAIPTQNYEINLFSLNQRSSVLTLHGHKNWIKEVTYNSDGTLLATAAKDYSVKIWDAQTGECLKTLVGHKAELHSLTFSKSGRNLASSDSAGVIRVWDLHQSNCKIYTSAHNNGIQCVRFSAEENVLISGSQDYSIKIWNTLTNEAITVTQGYGNWIKSIAFSPDGKSIVSGGQDSLMRLWDPARGECRLKSSGHQKWIQSVTYSLDGALIASSSDDCSIRIWDASTGKLIKVLNGHLDRIWSVAISPDGKKVASGGGSRDNSVRIWDIETGLCLHTLPGHRDSIYAVIFAKDGNVISCGGDRTVRVWDCKDGRQLKIIQKEVNWTMKVAFSNDRKILASADDTYGISLWDLTTGNLIRKLVGHSGQVKSLCFSPDDCILASGSDDLTIRLWNLANDQCTVTSQEHKRTIFTVAFSPDGQQLASCGEDATIKLWNPVSGEYLKNLAIGLPYQNMNITGVKGLTPAEIANLKALGAIDHNDPRGEP
jgi:WD40 repeat protein